MERDLIKVIGRFLKERNDGPRNKEPMESPIQEIKWERELAVENVQAKERMALELREMGFESGAIARILHLDDLGIRDGNPPKIAQDRVGRKE